MSLYGLSCRCKCLCCIYNRKANKKSNFTFRKHSCADIFIYTYLDNYCAGIHTKIIIEVTMSFKVRFESSLAITRAKLAQICELNPKIADLLHQMKDEFYHLAIMTDDNIVRGVAILITHAKFSKCVIVHKLMTFDEYDEKPFLLKINEFLDNKTLLIPLDENQLQISKSFVMYYNRYVFELICNVLQIV